MKTRQRVSEFVGAQRRNKAMEHREAVANFLSMVYVFDGFTYVGIFNEANRPPIRTAFIQPKMFALLRW